DERPTIAFVAIRCTSDCLQLRLCSLRMRLLAAPRHQPKSGPETLPCRLITTPCRILGTLPGSNRHPMGAFDNKFAADGRRLPAGDLPGIGADCGTKNRERNPETPWSVLGSRCGAISMALSFGREFGRCRVTS